MKCNSSKCDGLQHFCHKNVTVENSPMKRSALHISLMALAVSPTLALADTNVEVYGRAHLATYLMDDGEDYSAFNVASNASRLGFRASHLLDNNLTVMVQLEGQVDINSNQNRALTSRNSFLGLGSDWGLVRVGHFDTPSKALRSQVDLFPDQLGDLRNLSRNSGVGPDNELQGFDERFKNSIAYRTPTLNGFQAELHYSAETQNNDNAEDSNDNDAISGSISFNAGGLYAAIAHERWNRVDAEDERNVTRLAASYRMADWRFTGMAQRATDPSDSVYSLGSSYQLTSKTTLKAQYQWLDGDDSDFDATQLALGVNYQYAPELLFYANVAQVANDEAQELAPWRQPSTLDQTGAPDETARALSVGAVYSF
ncbi:MAG: porin [Halomonadaceae bacterium]|nr:MAG: porin [Halomonadaceae bacterium]